MGFSINELSWAEEPSELFGLGAWLRFLFAVETIISFS